MLLGEIRSLFIIATLSTHGNRGIQVKFEISRRRNELFQLFFVFQLGVAVQ